MQRTGLACPQCSGNGATNELTIRPGVIGYVCSSGHLFNDTEQLLALNPKKIAVAMPVQKPTTPQSELRVPMPTALLDAVRNRFKDKLEPTMVSVLQALLDSGSFIVTGFDAVKLSQRLGQKVQSAEKLTGIVYALQLERDEAVKKAEVQQGAAVVSTATANGDFVQVQLRLEPEQYVAIREKAKFNGMNPADYLSQIISTALSNGWM